jgi:hypothetical protein
MRIVEPKQLPELALRIRICIPRQCRYIAESSLDQCCSWSTAALYSSEKSRYALGLKITFEKKERFRASPE